MISNSEIVDDLNELVRINNDRILGYKKAKEDTKDNQLDDLFTHMIVQSQNFRSQLADHIVRIDGSGVSDATSSDFSSKVHRAWIDLKAAVTGDDRGAVLSSCEFGDRNAIEAYEEALDDDDLPAYIKDTLLSQLDELRQSYAKIESLRGAEA
jgi:uncharacterized protein (TIGR02284 family)